MNKEIYFLTDGITVNNVQMLDKCLVCNTYASTEEAIENRVDKIASSSLIHMSFDLIDIGYHIFLVQGNKKVEIEPGMNMPNGKEIRRGHNICKLFLAHCFDELFDVNP